MKNHPDTHLVTAAQAGDKAAFVDLVARYQRMVTGITLSILKDFQASEDAAQETFVTAWQKISDIQDREKLRPWLAQIARNSALMALRKKRDLPPLETFPGAAEVPRPDELVVVKEEAEIVMSALEALPEKLRLPLILFYRDDQSVRNVSEALSLTPDIVKKRLSEGRALLRRRVTRLLEPVLRTTGPGTLFTTAIAATIGAMTSPTAMAATAVSATHKTATLTAVTTSKLSLAATVLTLGLCLPGGYFLHQTLGSNSPSSTSRLIHSTPVPSSRRPRTTSTTTPLVAQWHALRARHLSNGTHNFPALFQEITTIKDPLQREAFLHLGIADWAKAGPDSALAYFTQSELFSKQTEYYQHRIISEWLRHDAPAALAAVEKDDLWSRGCSRSNLEFLSKGDPQYLARTINLLPDSMRSTWRQLPVATAFAEAARRDLAATTTAILDHLSASRRSYALAAIASHLSETDPSKASAWISQLAPEDQTTTLTKAYLIGLAKNNPGTVFQELTHLKTTLAWHQEAEILTELFQTNAVEAMSWFLRNPSPDLPELDEANPDPFQLNYNDQFKLQIFAQLEKQGPAFLKELNERNLLDHLTEFQDLMPSFDHPEILVETWGWLAKQDSSPGIETLRNDLLHFAIHDDPQQAFQLLEVLKMQPSYQLLSAKLADFIVSDFGSDQQGYIQPILANAPQIVLENMVAIPAFDLTNFENLTFWEDQFTKLSPQAQPHLAGKLAAALTRRNPDEAAQWIANLTDQSNREAALHSSYQEWVQNYPDDATQALDSLRGHPSYDEAAAGYLTGVAQFDPESAYSQLQEFGPSWPYFQTTADKILLPLAKHEPALAAQWLAELPFTDPHKQTLTRQFEEQQKQPSDPFAE